jgi:hypothetical protein
MRNAMALRVFENGFDLFSRYLELFRDFLGTQAVSGVADDRIYREPCPAENGRTALDPRVNFNQGRVRPIDLFTSGHIPYEHTIALRGPARGSICATSFEERQAETSTCCSLARSLSFPIFHETDSQV